jgi:hypothetical protein
MLLQFHKKSIDRQDRIFMLYKFTEGEAMRMTSKHIDAAPDLHRGQMPNYGVDEGSCFACGTKRG